MEYLIIFETVEGQTRKIVDQVAQQIQEAGQSFQLFNTKDKFAPLTFEGVDKVILAAPVHERRHPKSFEVLVAANTAELKARKTLMISVSLKAAFPESLEEAQDYLTEMEMRTGFTPDQEVLAAGAVRSESYSYFESQIVQHVALAGHDVNLDDGVREFTDWAQLRTDVQSFMDG
ncbi:menaquinone-dependent protoporphyrinogen IX dehydrogenase [Cognatishimia sp. WU-CL00825]|uniref:flavodoxin domain-containing protein n=1 Tax=Cognatishimia sp. WU-CL00825 TaxID=3127658 RepID=UPI003104BC6C